MKKINLNKNYFAIFAIALALLTGILVQSCQTDDSYYINNEKKEALVNFKLLLIETANTVEIEQLSQKKIKLMQNNSRQSSQDLKSFEKKAKSSLTPLLKGSITFLHSNGVSDSQLVKEFGSLDSPLIVLSSLFIFVKESDKSKKNEITLNSLFKLQTANAENWLGISDHSYSCLTAALGIAGIRELYQSTAALGAFEVAGATMTSSETLALVQLIGKRYLGWFGVAAMVYEFSECYYGF